MQVRVNRFQTMAINLLLPFFLFHFSASQVAGHTTKTSEGQQIEIGLKPDKESIMLGEPGFLAFEVKNLSAQDLCLGVGGDYRNTLGRPDSFKVLVAGENGKALPQPEAIGFGGFSGCARIPANGNYVVKLFLPHWATITETGSYRINVKRRMAFFNYEPKHATLPDPAIVLQADVSAHINVAPYDEERMGEVINSLGNAMLDIYNPAAGDAAQALAYIGDRRAIKYFARALEQFGEFEFGDFTDQYLISSRAVLALAQFDDDSAMVALEAAMWSPSNDTRLDVASAFVSSEHPKAFGLLLKMRNDSYWFVRLRVAQGLSKVKSIENTALLREMLRDEKEEVRIAARDGLYSGGRK